MKMQTASQRKLEDICSTTGGGVAKLQGRSDRGEEKPLGRLMPAEPCCPNNEDIQQHAQQKLSEKGNRCAGSTKSFPGQRMVRDFQKQERSN